MVPCFLLCSAFKTYFHTTHKNGARQMGSGGPTIVRKSVITALFALGTLHAQLSIADLQDEIQVYDDAINKTGDPGLELHVNTTPSGRSFSNYPHEVPPQHALRITPEFSYGLSQDFEAGFYLPTILNARSEYEVAGAKIRLKWLPIHSQDSQGWFTGVNLELSHLQQKYSESPTTAETRFMVGRRSEDWLIAFNPILDFNLSGHYRKQSPDLIGALKISRKVATGLATGLEYYSSVGRVDNQLPVNQQDNRIYLIFDVDREPWVFNFGIGRGLTSASDQWTLKALFEIPI
jgi:hypothetical protein